MSPARLKRGAGLHGQSRAQGQHRPTQSYAKPAVRGDSSAQLCAWIKHPLRGLEIAEIYGGDLLTGGDEGIWSIEQIRPELVELVVWKGQA